MKRLTTDNPITNFDNMLNYARARGREVILTYANGDKDVNLCEYIAFLANKTGCKCTAEDIRNGDFCLGCDCEIAILNVVATQAAALRERLKYYENRIEEE